MRLYELRSGSNIEVLLHPTSRDHGFLSSSKQQSVQFDGEYVLVDRYGGLPPTPPYHLNGKIVKPEESTPDDLAKLYGFGDASAAQPVGTGILVGTDSTVIQVVFYRVSPDRMTGDGVAKDNKGRYYRVFFSAEEG